MSGYPASYWENYGTAGDSYLDGPQWRPFFANIAARLKTRFRPQSVLDVGCAIGYLVEAFRNTGVAAWGIDTSSYAIDNARPGAVGHVRNASAVQPIEGTYDLLTCIEVLEHIPAEDADVAIANLCAASDNIIFSSTSTDLYEPTHVNVQPAEYWTVLFAKHGFVRDENFTAPYLCEWVMRFHR